MKHLIAYLCMIACSICLSTGYAQKIQDNPQKKAQNDQVDSRIDNLRYWMDKAAQGLVPYNPDILLVPAIFHGSQIRAQGVKTVNSPDVPVTSLTDVTESENSVFVDPNNADYLLNSNNSTTWTGTAFGSLYGANYFQSSNAGIGWVGTPAGAGGSANRGDPTTAIGLNGREYVNYISSLSGQGISYSDNGTTWSSATVAPNPGSLADKNHMWIDNKITSPYEGNLYVAWTDFGGTDDSEIKISRSVNDGVTWSSPLLLSAAINAGSHNQGVNIQTGPNGEVYAAWAVYDSWPSDETSIGFAKSTNGGATFPAATRIISNIRGIRTTAVSKNHRVNSFPSMAVDISGGPNNGNIYIVWTNVGTPGINTGTNKSVYMIRSTDGGTSWSNPIRVNQGPNLAGKEAYFPWLSCDPVTGVLSVVFYDDRNVGSTQCEVYSAYSPNAGNNWIDFVVSDVAFTPAAIPGLASGYMGDYLGITSKAGKIYPCWTDNRGGLYMTYVSPYELVLEAQFIAGNTTICPGSAVTFTDLSTGPPTSWNWSFPGGTPGSYVGQYPPAITYAAPGTYEVSLTVSDGSTTDTETKSNFITVSSVIADFSGAPTTLVIGNSVSFTDNSSCGPATWEWSFPGGAPSSFSGQNPPPVFYNTLGTYGVSLTVTKPGGTDTKTRSGYITVTPPVFNMTNGSVTTCTGDFYDSGGPSAVYQNNEVIVETFYPSTPGSMIRFNFTSFTTELNYDTLTIYNGVNSSAPVIGKYHGTSGPGTVTASNASGALTFRFRSDVSLTYAGWTATISCIDIHVPPVVDFSASTVNPLAAQTVFFTDLSTNYPTSWSWSFIPSTVTFTGGTIATSQNPQVQFPAPGLYTVTLTATNAYGTGTSTKTNYINVTNCNINVLPFTENFQETTIPGCWSQIDHVGNGQIWKFGVITGQSPNPALTLNYAYLNSDAYGSSGTQNADLISPSFDLSAYTGITLRFDHYFKSYSGSSGAVSYSIDNGSTWTQVQQFTTTSASNPVSFSQVIAALAGQPQVKFKWNYTGSYGWYWGIDNIQVTGTCSVSLPVSVSVAPSANPSCINQTVTYTATPSNGGTSPYYQWTVNGNIAAGGSNATFSYVPSQNDVVSCVLISSAICVTGNPATSNPVNMTVDQLLPVSVSVTASANPVNEGTPVTFTAVPVNGGVTPAYQWQVNAINAGSNNAVFTYVPVTGDQVSCVLISSEACSTGNPATSNVVTMTVNNVPAILNLTDMTISWPQCFNAIQTITVAGNNTTFKVQDGGEVIMVAGQNIIFYPGTSVEPGGILHGYISPDNPYCPVPGNPQITMELKEKTAKPENIFFRVYPNPTAGEFTLSLNGYVPFDKITVAIYNTKGDKIISDEIYDELKHEFSLSGAPAGLYLVRVTSGWQSGTSRIVKID